MTKFKSPSAKLQERYKKTPEKVDQLMGYLNGKTIIYIDYANVKPWAQKLGWHIDLPRLKQFFDAINDIKKVKIYYGTITPSSKSEKFMKKLDDLNYEVVTKPVKKMHLSIDAKTVPEDSPDLLKDFIRYPLLKRFTLEQIKYLNGILYGLNTQGIRQIEDWKCNFDVEIGRDMLKDFINKEAETYILFGSDSDFESPIQQLLKDGKKVILLATVRRVSSELSQLAREGLVIFDIMKIKEFICWERELEP